MIDVATYNARNPFKHMVVAVPEHPQNVITNARTLGGKLVINYMVDASDRLYIYNYGIPATFTYRVAIP